MSARATTLLAFFVLASAPACAMLLDFQDPIDKSDPLEALDREEDAAASTARTAETKEDAGAESCTCIPAIPDGWQGPLGIHEAAGTSLAGLPPCRGAYDVHVLDGSTSPNAPPASCSCSCGAPSGIACSAPVMTFFADKDCLTPCGDPTTVTAACSVLDTTGCTGPRFSISASVPTGGSCAPVASSEIAPVTWGASARLCALSPNVKLEVCDGGGICAPRTTLPFVTGARCIARSGEHACPAGYPHATTYYDGGSDTRACSACTCGSPEGASCAGAIAKGYSGAVCGGSVQLTTAAPASCAPLKNATSAVFEPAVTGGACAPSGGQPVGAFTPMTATTVCCTE